MEMKEKLFESRKTRPGPSLVPVPALLFGLFRLVCGLLLIQLIQV